MNEIAHLRLWPLFRAKAPCRPEAEGEMRWGAQAALLVGGGALLMACGLQDPFSEQAAMPEPSEEQGELVSALSGGELRALCASLNEELASRFDNRRLRAHDCTRLYLDSGDNLLCNISVADCVSESLAAEARTGAARAPEFEIDEMECSALRSCSASVTTFDACVAALFDQSDRLMSRVRCELANDPEAVDALKAELDARRPLPASCVDVVGACPGFF